MSSEKNDSTRSVIPVRNKKARTGSQCGPESVGDVDRLQDRVDPASAGDDVETRPTVEDVVEGVSVDHVIEVRAGHVLQLNRVSIPAPPVARKVPG